MTRFFHDVVPWWHLISPAFVIFVVLPLLYWSTTKRGDWSGWNGLAESYGVDAWPGDASDLGAPRYCRIAGSGARRAEIRPAAARRRGADGAVSARRVLRHGHDEATRRAVARGAQ